MLDKECEQWGDVVEEDLMMEVEVEDYHLENLEECLQ